MIADILNILLIVFWGLLLLVVVVVIHEGGHFLAARAFGVRVLEFMVGLPGPSIGFTHKGTRFGVTAIPFGGYARIAGMESGAENTHLSDAAAYLYLHGSLTLDQVQESSDFLGYDLEEALDILVEWGTCVRKKTRNRAARYLYQAPATDTHLLGQARRIEDPQAFIAAERKVTYRALPWWKRLVVLCAGPCANLLFAILVVAALLSLAGVYEVSLDVADVAEGSPAQSVGIASGDTITGIDGSTLDSYRDFSVALSGHVPGDTVMVSYEREGIADTVELTLAESEGRAILGVNLAYEHVRLGLGPSLKEAFSYIGLTCQFIAKLFNPAETTNVLDQSVSVVGIAYEAKAAAEGGFLNYIYLLAVVSISIGLMNLLPIPPLDGGKVLIETYQRIARRLVSQRVLSYFSVAGIVLVLALFVYVTGNDIQHYIIG